MKLYENDSIIIEGNFNSMDWLLILCIFLLIIFNFVAFLKLFLLICLFVYTTKIFGCHVAFMISLSTLLILLN